MKLLLTSFVLCILLAFSPLLKTYGFARDEVSLELVIGNKINKITITDLKQIKSTTYTMSTPWKDQIYEYQGVTVHDFMVYYNIPLNSMFKAYALNGYVIDVPTYELIESNAIICYYINGEIIDIKDKGPFMVLFPFHKGSEYYNEKNISLSIWFMNKIILSFL